MSPLAELLKEILKELQIANRLKRTELYVKVKLSNAGQSTRDEMLRDIFDAWRMREDK